jgi:hypothetical protein
MPDTSSGIGVARQLPAESVRPAAPSLLCQVAIVMALKDVLCGIEDDSCGEVMHNLRSAKAHSRLDSLNAYSQACKHNTELLNVFELCFRDLFG